MQNVSVHFEALNKTSANEIPISHLTKPLSFQQD